ncbi:MAG: conserved exported protein of unknown function [Nitrospira sp.]|nr:MAG: conserved exported protein of unknown function [Nitrospira sp.]
MGSFISSRIRARAGAVCLVLCALSSLVATSARGEEPATKIAEFSGTLLKRVEGKKHQAQVFAKGDRIRLEYKYALKTDYGYAAIEIVRLDKAETWYLLAQRKELLVVPVDPDDVLPVRPALPGEKERVLIGDATAVGRPAQLFEVQTDRHGRVERFFEWVDVDAEIVLKLVSRDRDWSVEYERIRFSAQPDYYFDEPPGYKKRASPAGPRVQG